MTLVKIKDIIPTRSRKMANQQKIIKTKAGIPEPAKQPGNVCKPVKRRGVHGAVPAGS
jgi:hypothetical protein